MKYCYVDSLEIYSILDDIYMIWRSESLYVSKITPHIYRINSFWIYFLPERNIALPWVKSGTTVISRKLLGKTFPEMYDSTC